MLYKTRNYDIESKFFPDSPSLQAHQSNPDSDSRSVLDLHLGASAFSSSRIGTQNLDRDVEVEKHMSITCRSLVFVRARSLQVFYLGPPVNLQAGLTQNASFRNCIFRVPW
ncbi:hypothetical protein ACMFMG_010164 [Clarireedia jacksonii]